MKQFEDKFRERLEGYEMKLPSMDQQSFWDRKAVRERTARRRRSFLAMAVGLPAAAAILMTIIMTIHLLSPQNSSQREQNTPTVIQSDSISNDSIPAKTSTEY
jgi:negative regulator of sigma E activity